MEQTKKWQGDNLYPSQIEASFGEHSLSLDVPEGVWNPTPHGMHLGNMLLKLDFSGQSVLELGTGCGIHAILLAYQGASQLTLTEIEQPINDNALYNLNKHHVNLPIETIVCDWTNLPSECPKYDVLVTNPPFGKSGKRYRRYFIDTLILDTHKLIKPGGRLVFVQSSMADIPRSIKLMEENGMQVRIIGEQDGQFRDYYFEDPIYMREMASQYGAYTVRDGKHFERLIVFEATLPK